LTHEKKLQFVKVISPKFLFRPYLREALYLCVKEQTDEKLIDQVCRAALTGVTKEEWEILEFIKGGEITSVNERVK
jgi:sulfur relay (sulfurtransferase) DsrC/TusE family protein